MLDHNFFNTIIVFPILNVLVGFYQAFAYLKIPGNFGFSIISLTVLIRVLLHPFFKQQLQTAHKMQQMKPHLDKISEKHKKNPQKLQEEQLKLYQEAGINPASGCLFMIIQLPVFYGLYQTLSLFFQNDMKKVILEINKVLYFPLLKISHIDPWFFGVNLAVTPEAGKGFYYLIPAITAILQYFQVQTSIPATPAPDEGEAKQKDPKKDQGDFQQAMNMQMKYVFPLMIGFFSLRMPVGLALYWNIFSLFSIIQYKHIHKDKPITNLQKK